jgi:hypothetical protein
MHVRRGCSVCSRLEDEDGCRFLGLWGVNPSGRSFYPCRDQFGVADWRGCGVWRLCGFNAVGKAGGRRVFGRWGSGGGSRHLKAPRIFVL